MLEKVEAIGRTAGHAAALIADRTAAVDPWALALGTLLYLTAQTVRPRGWHTILRAAFPEATDLRARDVIRAYMAGAGVNAIVPRAAETSSSSRSLRRRIEGARYATLAATFIPETLFETAFGAGLVAWALAEGFIPVPTTSGELPALDVSLVIGHPVADGRSSLVLLGLAGRRLARALRGALRQGTAILCSPRRFSRRRRELAGARSRHPPRLVRGLHGRLRPAGDAGHRRARDGRPGRRADPAARPGERRAAPGHALLRLRRGHRPSGRHRRHHRLHFRRRRRGGHGGLAGGGRHPRPGVRHAVAAPGARAAARSSARRAACSPRATGSARASRPGRA